MNSGMQRGLNNHPKVRFVLFLIFMALIVVWGLVHLVTAFNNHPSDSSKIALALIVSALILIPDIVLISSIGKSELQTARAKIILGVFALALILGIPWALGWTQFSSDDYWLQIPSEVALICFAPAAVALRVRQKFWRADWRSKK
jgi:hypothetical protein